MKKRISKEATSLSGYQLSAVLCAVLASALCITAVPTAAQQSAPSSTAPKTMADTIANLPMGSGAGVHSPNSPFAPLQDRADVLPWSLLTAVKTRQEKNRLLPVFPTEVQALNKKTQRVQGFMMPLEPGDKQYHFLLSSVPLSCAFCTPGGPESMVEVKSKTPVKYSMEAVVVEGQFAVLPNDPYGLYYRITDAVAVK